MSRFKREKSYIKCPYCKVRNMPGAKSCVNCGCEFSQMEHCSNKDAKQMLWHRRFAESFDGEIVNVKGYPKDVSKKKSLLLAGFLGLFGAHNLYLGRLAKGFLSLILGSIFFAISVYMSFNLNSPYLNTLALVGGLIGLVPVVFWLFDFGALLLNKYEIPVKLIKPIDIPEDEY